MPLYRRLLQLCCALNIQEQTSDIFHGFIRVVMNLIRPVQMSLASQPTSDVTTTSRDQDNGAKVTTFHLPKDSTKVIHITRSITAMLLRMLMMMNGFLNYMI